MDLTKYKPNPQVTSFEYDETLPDNELTFEVFNKLVLARKIQDVTFLAIGKMLKLIRDKKLYKYLDYENFTQFLASEEISFSREKAYLYIRTYELYVNQLAFKPDELAKMGIARLMMLAPLIRDSVTKEEAVSKIQEMEGMRYGDFVREIKSQTNSDGHPEVYFNKELNKWFVNYYPDRTELVSLGEFKE